MGAGDGVGSGVGVGGVVGVVAGAGARYPRSGVHACKGLTTRWRSRRRRVPSTADGRRFEASLPADTDPDSAEINGYPIDVLYANLAKLEDAASVQVFIDACFSGDYPIPLSDQQVGEQPAQLSLLADPG